MMKNIFLAVAVMLGLIDLNGATTVSYARKDMNVRLDLNWTSSNYGAVQWQQQQSDGTWKDIAGATQPTYTFKVSSDGIYRAKVEGDKACPPIYVERQVKVVTFNIDAIQTTSDATELEVSGIDLAGAEVAEYGFCYNYLSLNRGYELMNRVKAGNALPDGNTFTTTCSGLLPNQTYSLRMYIKTADGSMLFSSAVIVKTLEGLAWTTEDWTITKNEIGARFEIPGYSSETNPNVRFYLGKDKSSLKQYAVTKGDGNKYVAETVGSLEPNTDYVAVVKAEIDGEETSIEKTVRTLSDYSSIKVDDTVIPVGHTVRWGTKESLVQLSPEGQQVEYPRMLRVDDNKILLSYHGGSGSDYWVNCYLRKSYDNGQTWSDPVMIFDKEKSSFGSNYWRIVNPEMTLLKNGWILMSCVGNGKPETNENCHVLLTISKDGGETWGDPIIVGRGRTWEPQIVQLPNGELELYVSSEAEWWNGSSAANQEIVYARSTDNGETWTELKRASYLPGARDGMPAGLVMQGNKGILMTIESVNGHPSPSILHRGLAEDWEAGDWDGKEDDRRWGTPVGNAGGAPYCIQLPTGEVLISCHANQKGSVWQTNRPSIMVADNTGHNVSSAVTPLAALPYGEGAYYNSLFLKDNDTVWLLITHSNYDGSTRTGSAIECLEGKIVEKN